jgi:hypothetical protein
MAVYWSQQTIRVTENKYEDAGKIVQWCLQVLKLAACECKRAGKNVQQQQDIKKFVGNK